MAPLTQQEQEVIKLMLANDEALSTILFTMLLVREPLQSSPFDVYLHIKNVRTLIQEFIDGLD